MGTALTHLSTHEELRISLPERFTFQGHREFRNSYFTVPLPAKAYVVDFGRTQSIDSAGLGMLLQLCEFARQGSKEVFIVRCSPEIRDMLRIAGIQGQASILP
jgi:anti-anti-sigma regulatory factor